MQKKVGVEERKDLCESFGLTAKLLLFLHWRRVGKHVAVTQEKWSAIAKARVSAQWGKGVSPVEAGC